MSSADDHLLRESMTSKFYGSKTELRTSYKSESQSRHQILQTKENRKIVTIGWDNTEVTKTTSQLSVSITKGS